MAWTAGKGRAVNPGYQLTGAVMLLVALVIMASTVRRWAKYFVGVCFLAAAQAVFALLAGHTLSQPRLVTNRPLVSTVLVILIGLIFFFGAICCKPAKHEV
jgi:ABC-type Mn2+/Zn2+ transport system permease subunit